MKRGAWIFTILLLLIGIVGCNNAESEKDITLSPMEYVIDSDQKYNFLQFIEGLLFTENMSPDEEQKQKPLYETIEKFVNNLKKSNGLTNEELGFRKVVYRYRSIDLHSKSVMLSAISYWLGYYKDGEWYNLQPDNICLVEHYTIASNSEAPSVGFPFEPFMLGNNLVIMPDYIGYGATKSMVHPYLNHTIHAQNSIDALPSGYAVFDSLADCGMGEDWKMCVLGASQGAGNAIAIHQFMEKNRDFAKRWHFAYSSCSSGPYSPRITMEEYYHAGKTVYPVVFPLTINAMLDSYPEYMGKYNVSEIFSDNYLKHKDSIDEMVNSKNYTTHQINQFFYDHIRVTVDENLADDEIYLSDILNSAILNTNTAVYKDFEKCLEENDLIKGWKPTYPIKLYYSAGDRVVPYSNSLELQKALGSSKVTLYPYKSDFGHKDACTTWMLGLLIDGV